MLPSWYSYEMEITVNEQTVSVWVSAMWASMDKADRDPSGTLSKLQATQMGLAKQERQKISRDTPLSDRLIAWYQRSSTNERGCWLWNGSLDEDGYALVYSIPGGGGLYRKKRLHVVSFVYFKGPMPEGFETDHTCSVRRCWNPEHLEAVTHEVNVKRGERPNRTHCVKGHPFDADNTIWRKEGGRKCRYCDNHRPGRKRKT